MRTIVKVILWIFLIILVVGVVKDPEGTAGTVRAIGGGVAFAAGKAGEFFASLSK